MSRVHSTRTESADLDDHDRSDDHMKIAVCIKQVPSRDWQPRLDDAKTWIREPDADLRDERARRLRARGGAAAEGEARRRGGRLLGRAGAGRAGACAKRSPAAPIARSTSTTTRLASADAFVVADALAAAMADEQFDLILTGPAVRRPGIRADRRDPGGAPRPAARDHHHGRRRWEAAPAIRVKRELEGGWFQWVTMPLPRC